MGCYCVVLDLTRFDKGCTRVLANFARVSDGNLCLHRDCCPARAKTNLLVIEGLSPCKGGGVPVRLPVFCHSLSTSQAFSIL